jgi:UDP-N-acetylmuramoylalanine--D-glutamate ligase
MKEVGVEQGAFVRAGGIWLRQHAKERHLCSVDDITLRGVHNLANVVAASAIAAAAGFSFESITSGIRNFKGIGHRLEFIRNVGGVDWYNDSIATSPERAIAAIDAFEEPLVLLAGGRDKDLPWDSFAMRVIGRVKHLILFGEASELIEREVRSQLLKASALSIHNVEKFSEAVIAASKIASPGDVVLLAPGGTSFDEFRDFAERGDLFRQMVETL